MLNDYSTLADTNVSYALRVIVDNACAEAPISDEAAIYKMATGDYQIETYDGIGFKMRKVGEGTLTLSNLVLALRGDDAFKVYPINLNDAADPDGNELSELTSEYQDIVISPNMSIDDDTTVYELKDGTPSETKVLEKVLGFHLYATGECAQEIEISEVYLIKAGEKTVLDSFNRTQSGFDGDYDKSITNPLIIEAGLVYALSYNNADKVSVAEGTLVFDATNLAAEDYINFKEMRNACYNGEHYLVLSVKAIEGADFNNFRFNVGNGVVYVNDMVSAFGLPLPKADATDYVYTDENGFMWLVIDLQESGMVPAADTTIDFYYSGSGKLLVDCIFFADEVGRYPEYNEAKIGTMSSENLGAWSYGGWFDATSSLVKIVFDCADESTLKTIRICDAQDNFFWFKDGQVKDVEGNAIDGDTKLAGLTLIIDLAATGIEGGFHVHQGDFDGTVTSGAYTADVYSLTVKPQYTETLIGSMTSENLGAWSYGGWFDATSSLVRITFTCEDESTLKTIRICDAQENFFWFKDGQVKDIDGNAIDGDTKLAGLTLIIDLAVTGIEGGFHVHQGDFDGTVTSGAYTAEVVNLAKNELTYAAIMASLEQ